jgi:hypothetical protein
MRMRAAALAAVCALVGVVAVSGVATAGPGGDKKPHKEKKAKKKKNKKGKVAICHRTGNGSFHLIKVGFPAKKAHLQHGDVLPDAQGNCPTTPPTPPQPTRFTSPTLEFGPNGWGGWSCPAGMKAVGGGTTLTDFAAQGIAEPGATIGGETYPVFPHHTFAVGETGFVVQNDNDTESGTVFVDCVPV